MVGKDYFDDLDAFIKNSTENKKEGGEKMGGENEARSQAMNMLSKLEMQTNKTLLKASIVQIFMRNIKDMKVEKDVVYAFLDAIERA